METNIPTTLREKCLILKSPDWLYEDLSRCSSSQLILLEPKLWSNEATFDDPQILQPRPPFWYSISQTSYRHARWKIDHHEIIQTPKSRKDSLIPMPNEDDKSFARCMIMRDHAQRLCTACIIWCLALCSPSGDDLPRVSTRVYCLFSAGGVG